MNLSTEISHGRFRTSSRWKKSSANSQVSSPNSFPKNYLPLTISTYLLVFLPIQKSAQLLGPWSLDRVYLKFSWGSIYAKFRSTLIEFGWWKIAGSSCSLPIRILTEIWSTLNWDIPFSSWWTFFIGSKTRNSPHFGEFKEQSECVRIK